MLLLDHLYYFLREINTIQSGRDIGGWSPNKANTFKKKKMKFIEEAKQEVYAGIFKNVELKNGLYFMLTDYPSAVFWTDFRPR